MDGFNWTESRRKRLAAAVRKHNAAITRRERSLAAEGNTELIKFLPKRVTTAQVRGRIQDVNDFRRIVGYKNDAKRGRYSELERVSLKGAMEFTTSRRGTPTTRVSEKQYRYDRRRTARVVNEIRKALGVTMFDGDTAYDLADMGEQEYATLADNAQLRLPGEGVPDDSVEDLPQSRYDEWEKEDARNEADTSDPGTYVFDYLEEWRNPRNNHWSMPGYQQLIDDLNWLVANRPSYVYKMFNAGYDELDIPWIIESGDQRGGTNPYSSVPYDERHVRAVDFVHMLRQEAQREV